MIKRMVGIGCLAVAVLGLSSVASAQNKSFPFGRKVESDKDKTYWLTQDEGPWLILCATFSGENGMHQANDLVHELRSQHKLNAFVWKMKVDLPDEVAGAGMGKVEVVDPGHFVARSEKFKFANGGDFEEVAVLVGNFSAMDDKNAESTLAKIKFLRPKALAFSETTLSNQSMGYFREFYRRLRSDDESKSKGPMGKAFVIPNPLLPEEYFSRQETDKVILDLNRGIKHSLLDCPKPYSVRVATFRGETTFNLNEMQKQEDEENRLVKFGKPRQKSQLAEAGEKAHRLVTELRKDGIEAYEFHDRYESYVCVGEFDWITRKGSDGREQWNPEVVETINTYKASLEDGTLKGFPGAGRLLRPKSMSSLRGTDIVFDVQPVPIQVPQAGVGRR